VKEIIKEITVLVIQIDNAKDQEEKILPKDLLKDVLREQFKDLALKIIELSKINLKNKNQKEVFQQLMKKLIIDY
jgi:hypothetical protein